MCDVITHVVVVVEVISGSVVSFDSLSGYG